MSRNECLCSSAGRQVGVHGEGWEGSWPQPTTSAWSGAVCKAEQPPGGWEVAEQGRDSNAQGRAEGAALPPALPRAGACPLGAKLID